MTAPDIDDLGDVPRLVEQLGPAPTATPTLLPVGTLVRVTERGEDARTYVGRIVGYDLGGTKYEIGARFAGHLYLSGGSWAFPTEVEVLP